MQIPHLSMICRPFLGNLDVGGFMINRIIIKQQISILHRNVMYKSTILIKEHSNDKRAKDTIFITQILRLE